MSFSKVNKSKNQIAKIITQNRCIQGSFQVNLTISK